MAPKAANQKICLKYYGPTSAPHNPPQTNPPSAWSTKQKQWYQLKLVNLPYVIKYTIQT